MLQAAQGRVLRDPKVVCGEEATGSNGLKFGEECNGNIMLTKWLEIGLGIWEECNGQIHELGQTLDGLFEPLYSFFSFLIFLLTPSSMFTS